MQTCDHQGSLESNAVYQDVAPLAETIIKGTHFIQGALRPEDSQEAIVLDS